MTMTPKLWQRLKPLYEAALDSPPDRRGSLLAQVCGDDSELKNALGALLANDGETTALDRPIVDLKDLFPSAERIFADGELIQGRFKIVRHLGTGGMGEVYEATDLQLGRIALKTIRPGITANPELLTWFRHEAQLARKVSSPHVCRIHDLHLTEPGSDGSQRAFLTMEFLEGTTLADQILSGPLPWREALKTALEICAGLSSIHEAGIVHRDLKGRNIMLASRNGNSCAVLMDFGIARELRHHTGSTSTTLTADGAILGTPDYMAPEQFEGKEATPATDVYALGVVLYETLTGKRPFAGRSLENGGGPKGISRGRLPPSVSSFQPGAPHRLDRVICRCLEYDPGRRYQSAKEVELALRPGSILRRAQQRPLTVAAVAFSLVFILSGLLLIPAIGERVRGMLFSSSDKHIAVLPLDLVGDNPQTQALGDGLMDSLAGRLSNLGVGNKSLWVVPASEVRTRKVTDPSSALREFGATIVVKGSFERAGDAARLKLTLIDPKKTREIGFADVESQSGDLAALQDEAVTRLGRLMNLSFREDPQREGRQPETRAAYEDYLAGLGYFQRHDQPGNLERARVALQNAVKTDPRFALAFARLAEIYTLKYRLESNPQWLKQAEAYGKQAAELDAHIPSTYVALGQIHELTGKHDLAIEEFQRAIDLDPRDADAIAGMAKSDKRAGHTTQAEAAYIKAAALRPNDWKGYNDLGLFYQSIGRPSDAIAQFNHALELTPDNAWPYANLGIVYMNLDDPKMQEKAEEALKKSIAISPNFGAYGNLAVLYGEQHKFREAVAASLAALRINDQSYDLWGNLTGAYEWLGDDQEANAARRKTIELLERAVTINPENATARATLAALYAKIGRKEEAINGANISLALSPDNEYVLCQAAEVYELLGNRAQAIKYLEQALDHGLTRIQLNEDIALQGIISDPAFRMPGK